MIVMQYRGIRILTIAETIDQANDINIIWTNLFARSRSIVFHDDLDEVYFSSLQKFLKKENLYDRYHVLFQIMNSNLVLDILSMSYEEDKNTRELFLGLKTCSAVAVVIFDNFSILEYFIKVIYNIRGTRRLFWKKVRIPIILLIRESIGPLPNHIIKFMKKKFNEYSIFRFNLEVDEFRNNFYEKIPERLVNPINWLLFKLIRAKKGFFSI